MRRFLRRSELPSLITLIFIGFFLVILSTWIFQDSQFIDLSNVVKDFNYFLTLIIGILVGVFFTIIIIKLSSRGLSYWIKPLAEGISEWPFLLATLLSFLFLLVFIFVGYVLAYQGKELHIVIKDILKDSGGLFTILTGLATLYGLGLTLQGVWEIRRTISSFSDLIDRIETMAKTATDGNPIHILAYTPAIGYLAQPSSDWTRFSEALRRRPQGKPIVKCTCLRESDLKTWHRQFVGRRTLKGEIDQKLANQSTSAGEGLLNDFMCDSAGNKISDTVNRIPFSFMPGYYLFFTRERAIIVTPLFLPFPKGVPSMPEKLPTVQMIGLETQDRAIIRDIELMYEYYARIPESLLGEFSKSINSESLKTCINEYVNHIKDSPEGSELSIQEELERVLLNNIFPETIMDELREGLVANFSKTIRDELKAVSSENQQSRESVKSEYLYHNLLLNMSEPIIKINIDACIQTWNDSEEN